MWPRVPGAERGDDVPNGLRTFRLEELLGPCLSDRIVALLDVVQADPIEKPYYCDDRDPRWREYRRRREEAQRELAPLLEELADSWARPAWSPLLVLIRGQATTLKSGTTADEIPLSRAFSLFGMRGDVEDHFPVAPDRRRYRVVANPGIADWMAVERQALEHAAGAGLDFIRRALRALGRFIDRAKLAAVTAIADALGQLRAAARVGEVRELTSACVRELVAELGSPRVLASGGACAAFVPRI